MKKIMSLLLIITMLFLLAACGDKENNTNVDSDTFINQPQSYENTEAGSTTEKIVNDDGEEFIVDTTTTGEIKENYDPVSSTKITIDNVEYSLPFKSSELLNNGWILAGEFDEDFSPNTSTTLLSCYLVNDNNERILIDCIFNNNDTAKPFEECLVLDFEVYEEAYNYILPGGITNNSTAGDVLSVYENPYTTSYFEDGYNFDDNLYYYEQIDSQIDYQFTFNEDGTINRVIVRYQGDI